MVFGALNGFITHNQNIFCVFFWSLFHSFNRPIPLFFAYIYVDVLPSRTTEKKQSFVENIWSAGSTVQRAKLFFGEKKQCCVICEKKLFYLLTRFLPSKQFFCYPLPFVFISTYKLTVQQKTNWRHWIVGTIISGQVNICRSIMELFFWSNPFHRFFSSFYCARHNVRVIFNQPRKKRILSCSMH